MPDGTKLVMAPGSRYDRTEHAANVAFVAVELELHHSY